MTDIRKYLEFIKLNLPEPIALIKPSLLLLKQMVRAHLQAFPYQNTELFIQGKKPLSERQASDISIDALFKQMVIQKRSGYCFENTELLAWALTELGFNVTKHLVKAINCLSSEINEELVTKAIFGHECLIVSLNDDTSHMKWLVDTGFDKNSLREPLLIQSGEQNIATEQYRLNFLERANMIRLELKINRGWWCLYDFDSQPKSQDEIIKANRQLFAHAEELPIFGFLTLNGVSDVKRKSLVYCPGHFAFFKSLSSSLKDYDLVAMVPNMLLDRHTIAIEYVSKQSELNYRVLDPFCSKTEKTTLLGVITRADLEKKMGVEQTINLFNALEAAVDPLQVLKPVLSEILAITSGRGHTHRREKKFAANSSSLHEICELAKEKFDIELDEIALQAL